MQFNKLELVWKDKNSSFSKGGEMLFEDKELSINDLENNNFNNNRLINGDNLIAMNQLLPDFKGKIKCIYIDPPFNTKSTFEHYDDDLEHTAWLQMMYERLHLLYQFLSDDGAIFIHIDYNEEAYLRIILDEIFGRKNFRNAILVSRVRKNVRERAKVKSLNTGQDIILFYAKSNACMITPPSKNIEKKERWHNFEASEIRTNMDYDLFGFRPNPRNHWRWTKENADKAIQNYYSWEKDFNHLTLTEYWKSTNCELRFLRANPRTGKPEYFIPASETELLDTNWLDLVASSFNWDFPNGEKNEKLIHRILSMVTEPKDWVMDCFLGSGTTAAVAHKMNRHWIGIEMGDQMLTHAQPRLKAVCEGKDNKGISKDVNWQGGGGFRFFTL